MRYILSLLVLIILMGSIQAQELEYTALDYGQNKSIGLSIGGSSLMGMTFKWIAEQQHQWEINPGYFARLDILQENDKIESVKMYHGLSLLGCHNLFMSSNYNLKQDKVIKHYIGLKAGTAYTSQAEILLGLSYRREAFKSNATSFSKGIDLGLIYLNVLGDGFLDQYSMLKTEYIGLYIKFDWNWFR